MKETDGRKLAFLLYRMALDILESGAYKIKNKIIYYNKRNTSFDNEYILRNPSQGPLKNPDQKGLYRNYGLHDPEKFEIYIDIAYCKNEREKLKTLLHEALEALFSEFSEYKNDNVWGENKDIMDDFEVLIWKHLTKKEKGYLKEFLLGKNKK